MGNSSADIIQLFRTITAAPVRASFWCQWSVRSNNYLSDGTATVAGALLGGLVGGIVANQVARNGAFTVTKGTFGLILITDTDLLITEFGVTSGYGPTVQQVNDALKYSADSAKANSKRTTRTYALTGLRMFVYHCTIFIVSGDGTFNCEWAQGLNRPEQSALEEIKRVANGESIPDQSDLYASLSSGNGISSTLALYLSGEEAYLAKLLDIYCERETNEQESFLRIRKR